MDIYKPIAHIRECMLWNIVKGFGIGVNVASNFYDLDGATQMYQQAHDIPMAAAGYALKAGAMVGDAVIGMTVMDAVAGIDDHVYGYDAEELEYDDPEIED